MRICLCVSVSAVRTFTHWHTFLGNSVIDAYELIISSAKKHTATFLLVISRELSPNEAQIHAHFRAFLPHPCALSFDWHQWYRFCWHFHAHRSNPFPRSGVMHERRLNLTWNRFWSHFFFGPHSHCTICDTLPVWIYFCFASICSTTNKNRFFQFFTWNGEFSWI